MLFERLSIELAGERDDLSIVQFTSRRPAGNVLMPHALELEIFFDAAQPRLVHVLGPERKLDLAPAHQRDELLGHALCETENVASRMLPRFDHTKTHCGATFVYHRLSSESPISSLDTEFSTLFGSDGGEGGIRTPVTQNALR